MLNLNNHSKEMAKSVDPDQTALNILVIYGKM